MLALYRSKIETTDGGLTWSIAEADVPNTRDLAALQARRDYLAAFPMATEESRKVMVSRLFLRFGSAGAKATEEQVRAYAMDVARFPMWAIAKGFSDIIGGQGLKEIYGLIDSIHVQSAVRKAMDPIQDEVCKLEQIINAKPFKVAPLAADARKAIADAGRAMMRANAPEPAPRAERDARQASRFDDARAPLSPSKPARPSDEALRTTGRVMPLETEDAR